MPSPATPSHAEPCHALPCPARPGPASLTHAFATVASNIPNRPGVLHPGRQSHRPTSPASSNSIPSDPINDIVEASMWGSFFGGLLELVFGLLGSNE